MNSRGSIERWDVSNLEENDDNMDGESEHDFAYSEANDSDDNEAAIDYDFDHSDMPKLVEQLPLGRRTRGADGGHRPVGGVRGLLESTGLVESPKQHEDLTKSHDLDRGFGRVSTHDTVQTRGEEFEEAEQPKSCGGRKAWQTTITYQGQLPVEACDQHGNVKFAGTLQSVKLTPEGNFNLFSITSMIKKGWALGANRGSPRASTN